MDVNRNFIGASSPEPASLPGYVELDPLLNSCGAPGVRDEFRYWLGAGRSIVRDRGVAKLAKAIAEGQYRFPQGLFYGGAAAGESCRTLDDKRCLYLCVEIGTVNPLTLLSALRRENQAHHWTPVGSAPRAWTKRALLDVFAPRSRRWRRRSVAQGLDVLDRTLALSADLA